MSKSLFFFPVVIALFLYVSLGATQDAEAISGWAWGTVIVMLVSGYFMSKTKWYGAAMGLLISLFIVYKGITQDTGLIFDLKLPCGIFLTFYYFICSFYIYLKNKEH